LEYEMKLFKMGILLAAVALVIALAGASHADEVEPEPATDAPVVEKAPTKDQPAPTPPKQAAAAKAESKSGDGPSHSDLAAQATNPLAPLIQIRAQNYFIAETIDANGINSSGYSNQFDLQGVVPIPKIGFIPRAVFRPTIPVVTTPDTNPGPNGTSGLGDIPWVYIFAFDQKWGVLGTGPAGAFPTATDDRLGAKKWTLGPSAFGMYTGIPHFQMGALVFNTWSLGGPGNDNPAGEKVNQLSVQPLFNYHFGKGWYTGWGDQAITVDWEHGNAVYAPLSFRIGKVYAIGRQKLESNLQFIYNVGDDLPGKDRWGFKVTVSLLYPEN
jgi:hypothetical protein